MSEITEERVRETSLRDIYYVLFRHKRKMILFFFVTIITVTVGTLFCTEVYRSEAKLLVRLGRESVTLDPTVATGKIVHIEQTRKNEINSELEILKSHDLAEMVVDSVGLEAFLSKIKGQPSLLRQKAVLKLAKELEIEVLEDSSIISISYEAKSPRLAREIVTKLIDLYLEKHIAVHQTPGSHEFFVQQSAHLQDKLEQTENELRDLKNETGVSSIGEQRQVMLDHLSALEQEKDRTDTALAASSVKVQALKKNLKDVPETLGKLLIEQANLLSLQASVEIQKKQLADVRARLKALNDVEVRIKLLTREASIQEANYRKYSENLEQSRVDRALESERISNISVVQAATLPIKPVRPRKALNMALGFLLGIFGAIGLAFFSEYSDHSIKTLEEVEEKLQLPALAYILSIPRLRANGVSATVEQGGQARNRGNIAEKTSAKWNIPAKIREHYKTFREHLLLRFNGSKAMPELVTTGEIRENYEAFRERLLLCSNGSIRVPYVLAFIGCHRHEGVSTVAANFATTLSRHDNGRVLLVDSNIRHPSVHRIFKANLSPGLSDVLANGQSHGDAIQSLPEHNLHILSAGTTNGNLSEIFDSDRFTNLLNSIKNHYSFVVIDIPALNDTSSAARLASLCDGVVLVVEAERSRWEIAQRAKEQLVKSNANVLGVVLNKRRLHIPEWLYQTL